MSFYIGVATCCGNVTAALVDDEKTTKREIGNFAADLVTRGREIKHVETLDGLRIARCRCNDQLRDETIEALKNVLQTSLQNHIGSLGLPDQP